MVLIRSMTMLLPFLVLLAACGGGSEAEPGSNLTVETAAEDAHKGRFELEVFSTPMMAELPEDMEAMSDPYIETLADGSVVVSWGEMAFKVTREDRSIEQLKEEIRGVEVFELTILNEGDDALMYEQRIPDGPVIGVCYMRRFMIGEKAFVATTDDQQEYSLYEARQLARIINSLHDGQ